MLPSLWEYRECRRNKKNKKPQNSSAEVILVAQAVYGFSPGGSRVTAVAVNTQTKKIHT